MVWRNAKAAYLWRVPLLRGAIMRLARTGATIAACLLALVSGAEGQTPSSSARTPDGRPDFQGFWVARWVTPLERPDGVTGLTVPAGEADALGEMLFKRMLAIDADAPTEGYDKLTLLQMRGEFRSSLMTDPADGKLPYTAETRAARAAAPSPSPPAGPEQRALNERCIAGSNGRTPLLVGPASNLRQVVQTPDTFVFLTEHMGELRIIPLDGRAAPINNLHGSSSGHWEGETLVVQTTGFRPGENVRNTRIAMLMLTPASQVTERFSLLNEKELLYTFTIDDPAIYARPWSAEFVFQRTKERMFEYACHEGNYSLANMLSGARVQELRADVRGKR
jgi:hypothetical protein